MSVAVDDRKWKDIIANVAQLSRLAVKVGVLDGAAQSDDGTPLVEIALFNEFGTDTIPERSFIRRTFALKTAEAVKIAAKIGKLIVTRGMPADMALELLGQWGAAAAKRTITAEDIPPPNAPATVAAKGSSKPLVDTGQLVNSITYVVEDK